MIEVDILYKGVFDCCKAIGYEGVVGFFQVCCEEECFCFYNYIFPYNYAESNMGAIYFNNVIIKINSICICPFYLTDSIFVVCYFGGSDINLYHD